MAFGTVMEYLVHDQPGKDETGFGRWLVMTFKGETCLTCVVCGNNPCYTAKPESSTTYQQHRCYFITQHKDITYPRVKFREDLVAQLQQWRAEGYKLIVCLDTNEHMYCKALGKSLTDLDRLSMREVVGDFTGKAIGSTCSLRDHCLLTGCGQPPTSRYALQ